MLETDGFEEFGEDVARLRAALGRYSQIARRELGRRMERALLLVQGRAGVYPAEIGYRRTGTLGRLWTGGARVVEMGGSGALVVGTVGNATPYGVYVQSEGRQAGVHRGRWQTIEDVLRESEVEVGEIMGEAVDAILARIAREAR